MKRKIMPSEFVSSRYQSCLAKYFRYYNQTPLKPPVKRSLSFEEEQWNFDDKIIENKYKPKSFYYDNIAMFGFTSIKNEEINQEGILYFIYFNYKSVGVP